MTEEINNEVINEYGRTETLKKLEVGQSIMMVPYAGMTYAKECAAITSAAARLKTHYTVKRALVVIEGEIPFPMVRVTRTR